MGWISRLFARLRKTYKLYTVSVNHYLNDDALFKLSEITVVARTKSEAWETARQQVIFANQKLGSWFYLVEVSSWQEHAEIRFHLNGKQISLDEIDPKEIPFINQKNNLKTLQKEFNFFTIERDCTSH